MESGRTVQKLHGSGTVTADGAFRQALQMGAKHFRMRTVLSVCGLERKTSARLVSPSRWKAACEYKQNDFWVTEGLRTFNVSPCTCRVCSKGLEIVNVVRCNAVVPTDYSDQYNDVVIIH